MGNSPVPAQLTPFVGRIHTLRELRAALAQSRIRLLTLVGPGGVGKTRIAMQLANDLAGAFEAGVSFIPLAHIRDSALLLSTIASHQGLTPQDTGTLLELLGVMTGPERSLLVLDNFEQIVDAAPVLTDVLAACPSLTILVTSRTVLRASGEHVFPIPTMNLVPEPLDDENIDVARPIPAGLPDAVALFIERAATTGALVDPTPDTIAKIATICAKLDGLPLAIELAAGRLRLLSLDGILKQMESRLQLLGDGPRDVPDRLRTMSGAIDWSYALLSPSQQRLFQVVSAFVGGATLEAIADVFGSLDRGDEVSSIASAAQMLNELSELVDQSLVTVIQPGPESRYGMLEITREFGLQKLAEQNELEHVRDLHSDYALALATGASANIDGPDATNWLSRLDIEQPNLREAHNWLVERVAAQSALRLASALWRFWRIRGYLAEGRTALRTALGVRGPVLDEDKADALWKLGYLECFLGEYKPAQDHLEDARRLFALTRNVEGEAAALDTLGLLWSIRRNHTRSREAFEAALVRRTALGVPLARAETLSSLGMLELLDANFQLARDRVVEALHIAERIGARREIANNLLALGRIEFAAGELSRCAEYSERALHMFEELGDQIDLAPALEVLGQVASAKGDRRKGLTLLILSLKIRLEIGLYRSLGAFLERLADAAVERYPDISARVMAATAADRARSGIPRLPWDDVVWQRAVKKARAALGATAFDTHWNMGLTSSVLTAAHDALAALESSQDGPQLGRNILGLTRRELEVLQAVARGLSNHDIADELFLSPGTVKRHLSNIFNKMDVVSRSAAVARARDAGVI